MNHRLFPFAAPPGRTEMAAIAAEPIDLDFCCAACARAAGRMAIDDPAEAVIGAALEPFDPQLDFDRAAVSRLAEAAWRRSAG